MASAITIDTGSSARNPSPATATCHHRRQRRSGSGSTVTDGGSGCCRCCCNASRAVTGLSVRVGGRGSGSRPGGERRRAIRSAEHLVVPDDQDEERPDGVATVGAAGEVLVDQATDGGGVEQALAAEPGRGEEIAREVTELAAEPGRDRDVEALLPAAEDLRRKPAAHGAPQEILRGEAAQP